MQVAAEVDFWGLAEKYKLVGGAIINVLRYCTLISLRQQQAVDAAPKASRPALRPWLKSATSRTARCSMWVAGTPTSTLSCGSASRAGATAASSKSRSC